MPDNSIDLPFDTPAEKAAEDSVPVSAPLAVRMRPRALSEVVGHAHILGKGCLLPRLIESDNFGSLIFYGPPGCGKTTLAGVIARETKSRFVKINAVLSNVAQLRDILSEARYRRRERTILFIDEIHRFNKSQQDSLLAAVETGTATLIGATTENPSFEIIRPLLSRAQVYVLKPLTDTDLNELLHRAITCDSELKQRKVEVVETDALFRFAGGDARKMLNILDLLSQSVGDDEPIVVRNDIVTERLQQNPMAYDKGGEMHYDIVSAFIKSIRGSNPDAAVYWLARMIAGGEDPAFIARRLVISAAEDIGLANPNALLLANATFDALQKIGWPEGRIILSECVVYLATSPKSNSAYNAINEALDFVDQTGNLPVPLHLRNAPTKLMKEMGYGADYKYPHSYPGNFVEQDYLPHEIRDKKFWNACQNPQEARMTERMDALWSKHK